MQVSWVISGVKGRLRQPAPLWTIGGKDMKSLSGSTRSEWLKPESMRSVWSCLIAALRYRLIQFMASLSCAQQLQCRCGNEKLKSQAPPTEQHRTIGVNKTDKIVQVNTNKIENSARRVYIQVNSFQTFIYPGCIPLRSLISFSRETCSSRFHMKH